LPPEGDESISFARQQKVSRELIQKAAFLKASLTGGNQEHLRRLIADLELVLLQLANYSAENSVPLIEMVKQGVDKKSILLKINLEQLRALDPHLRKKPGTITNGQKS
jgi:hypothetical protein